MSRSWVSRTRKEAMRTALIAQSIILAVAVVLPLVHSQDVSAGQLTSRRVTITSGKAGQLNVSYEFRFTFPTAEIAQGIIFEFCTTPLGSCTKPTGMDVSHPTAEVNATQTFSQSPVFTEVITPSGDCNIAGTNADTKYCVSRTGGTSGTAETTGEKVITINGITNPTLSGTSLSIYPRINIYNNDAFTPGANSVNIVHYGAVATAITQQLTVTGRVQERLEFCVAAVDDGGAGPGSGGTELPANCAAAPTTTNIDLGVIDSNSITFSPVDATPTNGANDYYGIAFVNTNAAGGITVAYYAESDTNVFNSDVDQLRAFRVAQADCSPTEASLTDQCFVSASATGDTFVAGDERFGLSIPCIDNAITSPGRSTTTNMSVINTAYNSDGNTASSVDCENTDSGAKYAWNTTTAAVVIASSTNVVDDEIVKLRFGATASPTTPTGLYRVTTTYIATPIF